MRFYRCMLILCITIPQAFADCSVKETLKLYRESLSEAEIEQRCNKQIKLPVWLSGLWEEQGRFNEGCGAFNAGCTPWFGDKEFVINDNGLEVYRVSDADLFTMKQRHRLSIANVRYDGATLRFTIVKYGESEEIYTLDMSNKHVLRGRVEMRMEERYGLPPYSLAGKVKLVKR